MKGIFTFVVIVLAGASVYFLFYMSQRPQLAETLTPTTLVRIGSLVINAEVVSTSALRTRGLSGRASLLEGKGMLFVFLEEGNWGIWMKEMQFPLDIVWAKKDGTITTIVHDVATSTYPEVFYPRTADAYYVLEIPAGYAEKQQIAEGMKIVL